MASERGVEVVPPDVWRHLSQSGVKGEELLTRLALPSVSDRVLAAIDSEGKRHFLLSLEDGEQGLVDKRSRGIDADTRELAVDDSPSKRYLDLRCVDALGNDVFDALGAELAATIRKGGEEPAKIAKRLLAKWRRFWDAPPPPLSRTDEIGLMAEVWFLAFWLIPKIGVAEAVDCWRGPMGARHDIELREYSVEIKGSTSVNGRKHHIHGIEQLAEPEGGELYLFSLAMREEGGATNTLDAVIERLRDIVSVDDDATIQLETRLARSGYRPLQASSDEVLRVRITSELLYRVDAAFPRLTPASLRKGVPGGVENVEYIIDVAGYESCIVARSVDEFVAL